MAFTITTGNIMGSIATLSINGTQHNDTQNHDTQHNYTQHTVPILLVSFMLSFVFIIKPNVVYTKYHVVIL